MNATEQAGDGTLLITDVRLDGAMLAAMNRCPVKKEFAPSPDEFAYRTGWREGIMAYHRLLADPTNERD